MATRGGKMSGGGYSPNFRWFGVKILTPPAKKTPLFTFNIRTFLVSENISGTSRVRYKQERFQGGGALFYF
jgi:hypothetical protein